jgi:tetratricopeptide (TPR) repeat protein
LLAARGRERFKILGRREFADQRTPATFRLYSACHVLYCAAHMNAIVRSLFVASLVVGGSVGCSRNGIEAVNLSLEADKDRDANPESAIQKYEQAVQLDPDNHRILWKLARTYEKKEAWDKVATTCAKAEKADKSGTFAEYYYLHGLALARLAVKGPTAWTEAKGPLENAIQKDANYAAAYMELGTVMYNLDDEAGAIKNYAKAIELRPDKLNYYTALASLYRELNMLEAAEGVLKEGLSFAKDGKDAEKWLFNLHSQLGDVLVNRNNVAGAIPEFEAAKKTCGQCNEPGQPIAYYNLGAAYAALNPPRLSEAKSNLANFQKLVCKGTNAVKYADQCTGAAALETRLGGKAL